MGKVDAGKLKLIAQNYGLSEVRDAAIELEHLRNKVGRMKITIKKKDNVIRTIEHHNNRLVNDNRAKASALETFYEKHRLITQHLQDKGVMKDWTKHELDVLINYLNQLEKDVAKAEEFANYKMKMASDTTAVCLKAWEERDQAVEENKNLREALEDIATRDYTVLEMLNIADKALAGEKNA